jgi:hypothetical protein
MGRLGHFSIRRKTGPGTIQTSNSLAAVSQDENRAADVVGQVWPSVYNVGEIGRKFDPICATSEQPQSILNRKDLCPFAL